MDEAERLIATFRGRPSAPVRAKVDTLLELGLVVHPRVVSFFLEVLADREEPIPVRIHVLRHLRNKQLGHGFRAAVAEAIVQILTDRSVPQLRLQAALALAEFTDLEGVLAALGGLALNAAEPIDLRYLAFTSLERAGPNPECVALLRRLSTDEALGRSAASTLSVWRVA